MALPGTNRVKGFVPCSPLGVGQYPLPLGLSLSLVRLGAGSRHRGLRLALGQLRQERVLGLEEVCVNRYCRPSSVIGSYHRTKYNRPQQNLPLMILYFDWL